MKDPRGVAENAEQPSRSLDTITGAIVDTAFKLHTGLGPGLLESVYEAVLARDLARQGFAVERQRSLSFEYDGLHFDDMLRIDLLVEKRVVVEIKSIERSFQTAADISPASQSAGRSFDQLRRSDSEGRSPACGQCSAALRVSAPPREPTGRPGVGWTARRAAVRTHLADLWA